MSKAPDSPSVSLVHSEEEMASEDVNVEMAELGSDLRTGHHDEHEEEEWQEWQGFQEYEFSDHPIDVKDVKSLLEAEVNYGEWKSTNTTTSYRRRRPASQIEGEQNNNNQPQQPADSKYHLPQSPLVTFTLEVMDKVASVNNYSIIFLVILGLLAGVLSATIDITIFQLRTGHRAVLELTSNIFGQYILWVVYTTVVLWCGITLTIWLAPQAAGSGVPEMRMVVSGVFLKNVLSFKAMIVKILGICMSLGSGAIFGKEGPFIHLTCILANQMMTRLPFFKTIRQSEHLMLIILGAACATGVAAHFGAPVGGVLFSIEVTSTYYPTRNYWYAYLGTVTGAAAWRYVWNGYFRFVPGFLPNILTGYTNDIHFTMVEIIICSIMGAVLGVISLGFVRLNAGGVKLWRRIVRDYRYVRSPYVFGLFIAVLTATVTFPPLFGSFMDLSPAKALGDLVSIKELGDTSLNALGSWGNRNIYVNLLIFVVSRYILIPLSIIVPIPGGLFVPALSLGAGMGRIVGEIVRSIVNSGWLWVVWEDPATVVYPGLFAIVGAASFTTAVTHTLSPAVIIFEITGSNVHIIPVLVGVITAFATARKFSSLGIYDSLSRLKGLPTLPDLQSDTYTLTAKDMMETNVKYIKKDVHFDELGKILVGSDQQLFPVVHSEESKLLVGTIEREHLEMAYNNYQAKQIHRSSEEDEGGEGLLRRSGTASLVIKPTPIRFVESTPLIQIHLLFTTMRLTNAFVTRNGALRGMITRQGLKAAIERVDKKNTILND